MNLKLKTEWPRRYDSDDNIPSRIIPQINWLVLIGRGTFVPTTAAFQSDAFDFGFDTIDIVPALFKIVLTPPHQRIEAGQSINITVYVIDDTSTPGRVYPFTLINAPLVELFNPSNISLGSATLMRQTGNGIYSYIKSTDTNDTKGTYSAVFTAVNGVSHMVSKKHAVYTII